MGPVLHGCPRDPPAGSGAGAATLRRLLWFSSSALVERASAAARTRFDSGESQGPATPTRALGSPVEVGVFFIGGFMGIIIRTPGGLDSALSSWEPLSFHQCVITDSDDGSVFVEIGKWSEASSDDRVLASLLRSYVKDASVFMDGPRLPDDEVALDRQSQRTGGQMVGTGLTRLWATHLLSGTQVGLLGVNGYALRISAWRILSAMVADRS